MLLLLNYIFDIFFLGKYLFFTFPQKPNIADCLQRGIAHVYSEELLLFNGNKKSDL